MLAAVRELGYHRNENARSLRPGQASGLIGVAITNLGNPYYGNFALGVEEAVAETGRRIVLGNTGGDPAASASSSRTSSAGRSRVWCSCRRAAPPITCGRSASAMCRSCSHPAGSTGSTWMSCCSTTSGAPTAARVRCSMPGTPGSATSATSARPSPVRAGTRGTCARWPSAASRSTLTWCSASIRTPARRATRRDGFSISSARRPRSSARTTATASARCTRSAADCAAARAPADLPALVSFDDFELAELMPVPVTVVDHDPRELGREAARLLLSRLGSGDRIRCRRESWRCRCALRRRRRD